MKKYLFAAALMLLSFASQAQEIVVNQNLADTAQKKRGPNLKVFRQSWIQLSFFTPFQNNAAQSFTGSYHLGIGHRVKYKLNRTFSWGWGLAFHFNHHRLKGVEVLANYPVSGSRKEKFLQRQFAGELFFRTNFGKRGNVIGKFLDIGVSGGYNTWNTFRIVMDEKDLQGNKVAETTINLRKTNKAIPYSYGLIARIGINKFVISGEWRLSELFKSEAALPELSPMKIGIQLGL
ncbi:MAG: hypothetical protein RLZZ46_510 [Bacteroidota bacterium]